MTEEQALQVRELRMNGAGYIVISQITGLPRDTIRSYCKARGIAGYREVYEANLKDRMDEGRACAYCGGPLVRPRTGRPRKFCSEACRRKYWKIHRANEEKNENAIYTMECQYCHQPFEVYGKVRRKYCSHEHYILARFGNDKRAEASKEKSGDAFLLPERTSTYESSNTEIPADH